MIWWKLALEYLKRMMRVSHNGNDSEHSMGQSNWNEGKKLWWVWWGGRGGGGGWRKVENLENFHQLQAVVEIKADLIEPNPGALNAFDECVRLWKLFIGLYWGQSNQNEGNNRGGGGDGWGRCEIQKNPISHGWGWKKSWFDESSPWRPASIWWEGLIMERVERSQWEV